MNVWNVRFSTLAKKQYKKMKLNGTRPPITDAVDFLMIEIKAKGADRIDWPNYGKLSERTYHCHLRKGKPTFVACWRIVDLNSKKIEVYYVGTHEGAPY